MKTRTTIYNQKDAYYFSHDANARHDPKIQAMLTVYGGAGYGWFWIIIELLREQSDYRLSIIDKYIYDILAKELCTDKEKAKQFLNDCIQEFELFLSDGEYFWNNSLIRRMQYKEEKSNKARESALKRWGKTNMQSQSDCNGSKLNNNKKNKIDENEIEREKKGKELIPRNDESFRLSVLLFNTIKSYNDSFKEPDINRWAKEMKKIIEVDKRKPLDLELAISFLPDDSFYYKIILNPRKLRQHFDPFFMKNNLHAFNDSDKISLIKDLNGIFLHDKNPVNYDNLENPNMKLIPQKNVTELSKKERILRKFKDSSNRLEYDLYKEEMKNRINEGYYED